MLFYTNSTYRSTANDNISMWLLQHQPLCNILNVKVRKCQTVHSWLRYYIDYLFKSDLVNIFTHIARCFQIQKKVTLHVVLFNMYNYFNFGKTYTTFHDRNCVFAWGLIDAIFTFPNLVQKSVLISTKEHLDTHKLKRNS